MCFNVQTPVSRVDGVVASGESPLLVLGKAVIIKYSPHTICVKQQFGPARSYRVPVILVHDLCEDG